MSRTTSPEITPPALLHNLKHNKVLHERVLLLTVGFGFAIAAVSYALVESPCRNALRRWERRSDPTPLDSAVDDVTEPAVAR